MYKCILLVLFLFIVGCGENSSNSNRYNGLAQLGNLANAEVKIYKIEGNGTKTLKWSETTTDGKNLDDIGKFNNHAD